jgi:hypothetical protein
MILLTTCAALMLTGCAKPRSQERAEASAAMAATTMENLQNRLNVVEANSSILIQPSIPEKTFNNPHTEDGRPTGEWIELGGKVFVWIDPGTGCQFLSPAGESSPLIERRRENGTQVCSKIAR